MDMLRIGLLGCGSMGSSLAKTAHGLDAAEVVAVSDVVEEKARKLAGELGEGANGVRGVKVFSEYRALLAQEDVDAVIVASPGYLHEEMVVAAAEAGKHLFCEKPMAFSVAACDRMIRAAKEGSVKLMIGQVLRYLPVFNRIKEIVDSDTLGRPFGISITRIGGGWRASGTSWRLNKAQVGGVLYEVSVHELDFMRYIAGDVDRVAAFAGQFVETHCDYEDLVQILLHFQCGGSGSLLAGMSSAIGSYEGKILCEQGSIFFGWSGLRYKPFDGEEVRVSKEEIDTEPGVRREVREFVEAVLEDTEPTIPGEEGRKVIEMVEAAYRSAEEMREVALTE